MDHWRDPRDCLSLEESSSECHHIETPTPPTQGTPQGKKIHTIGWTKTKWEKMGPPPQPQRTPRVSLSFPDSIPNLHNRANPKKWGRGRSKADQHPLQALQCWGVKKQRVSPNCFTPVLFSQFLIKRDPYGSIKCYSKIPSHIHLPFTSTKRQGPPSSKPFPWQVFQHQPWH